MTNQQKIKALDKLVKLLQKVIDLIEDLKMEYR